MGTSAKSHSKAPARVEESEQPLIIEYTNLLHQYRDPDAKEVRAFRRKHAADRVFRKRAEVLNKVFKLKAELSPVGS